MNFSRWTRRDSRFDIIINSIFVGALVAFLLAFVTALLLHVWM